MTLLANGINPDGWPLDDVIDVCDVLEATGRTVEKTDWVAELQAQSHADTLRTHG